MRSPGTVRRGVLAAAFALTVAGALASAPAALADEGDDDGPIQVGIGRGSQVTTTIRQPGTPGSTGHAANGAGTVNATGGGPVCTYTDTPVSGADDGTLITPVGAGDSSLNPSKGDNQGGMVGDSTQGRFVTRFCGGTSTVVWVPTGAAAGPAGVPLVTPAMLAEDARNLLPIPVPTYDINGWGYGSSLVNMPTWWWVTNADGTLTQRTSLGAVWAEVTATPTTSTWTPNNTIDAPVTCNGMGIAWQQGMSEDQAGHCGVTYTTASFRRLAGDDQAFDSQLRVSWDVTWVGSGGTGGTLDPLSMAVDIPMQVYERQVFNRPPDTP